MSNDCYTVALEIFGYDNIDVRFNQYNTYRIRVVEVALSWYVQRYGRVFSYNHFSAIKSRYDKSPHEINEHFVEHVKNNITKYVPEGNVETIELHSKGVYCVVDLVNGYDEHTAFYKSDLYCLV